MDHETGEMELVAEIAAEPGMEVVGMQLTEIPLTGMQLTEVKLAALEAAEMKAAATMAEMAAKTLRHARPD